MKSRDQTPPPPRPPSQPVSGRSSPMSESGSFSFSGRRGSSSSSHSLAGPPLDEPDLSHLSKEERAQIEAVIARAREMQQEGDQQVRCVSVRLREREGFACDVCKWIVG